ncbi:MAG: Ig-like domain-containing protein [Chloroflexi bacterium]|nr:Ig-like domain-containing protein [Chloroflexota bacterium]
MTPAPDLHLPADRRRPRGAGRLAAALAALVVAASAATVAGPASSVRAATPPDSDIPGVPLPGPVVTGTLGGPVYDRVYSLSVPPGNVILASLTGAAGTDFDLYLFDATATTVLANPPVGLVAKSTSDGSTESVSYPSRSGGTYYIDLNGATDVEGSFQLTVTILADPVPPTATLRIQGGATSVSDPTVTLTIVAQDALSGVDVMSFSTDGTTWLPWQPYVPTMLWTFPGGDGVKRLWVRVRDRAGNVSATADASTILDTTAPTVVAVSPPPDSVVGSLRPEVRVVFSKSMTPVWWTTGGLSVRPLAGGPDVPGIYTYDDPSRTGTFTPVVDLVAGTIYQVQINSLYDTAGNKLVPYPAWSFTPKLPVPLTLALMPSAITAGGSAVVAGSAVMAAPAAVEVEARAAGATSWTTIASVFPDGTGAVRVPVAPTVSTVYRLRVAGTATTADSTSTAQTLTVRTAITLAGLVPGVSTVRAGKVQPLLAQLRPATGGVLVTFRMYRWDTKAAAWKLFVQTTRRTNADGLATWSWTHRVGKWYFRATSAATSTNAAGTSAVYRWNVR